MRMGLFKGIKKVKGYYDTVRRQAKTDYAYGGDVTRDALAGLDELDRRANADLDTGGLPPYLADVFLRERGAITDEAQRSRRSFQEDLLQTARRSGGRFDPTSAVDYQIEREAAIDEGSLNARNDLAKEEAGIRLENTQRSLDRLFAIRERKLGAGQAERDRTAQMWLNAIGGRANFMTTLAGIGMGGMTGAASGGTSIYLQRLQQARRQRQQQDPDDLDGDGIPG
jgi:hypothetical protein